VLTVPRKIIGIAFIGMGPAAARLKVEFMYLPIMERSNR